MKRGMTDKQYVEARGAVCPFCGSEHIYADSAPDVDEGECRQSVQCLDCAEQWTDVYRLQGYLSATGATFDDAEAHVDDGAEACVA